MSDLRQDGNLDQLFAMMDPDFSIEFRLYVIMHTLLDVT